MARLLLVEDEEMNRNILEGYLKKTGYETTSAENGAQGIEILQKDKKIDVIHPMSRTKKREELFHFTKAHLDLKLSIITKYNNNNIKSLEDLKNKKLAVVNGWSSTSYLKKHYPQIIFKEYKSSKEKLEALAFGEVDASIDGFFTANYIMQKNLL